MSAAAHVGKVVRGRHGAGVRNGVRHRAAEDEFLALCFDLAGLGLKLRALVGELALLLLDALFLLGQPLGERGKLSRHIVVAGRERRRADGRGKQDPGRGRTGRRAPMRVALNFIGRRRRHGRYLPRANSAAALQEMGRLQWPLERLSRKPENPRPG